VSWTTLGGPAGRPQRFMDPKPGRSLRAGRTPSAIQGPVAGRAVKVGRSHSPAPGELVDGWGCGERAGRPAGGPPSPFRAAAAQTDLSGRPDLVDGFSRGGQARSLDWIVRANRPFIKANKCREFHLFGLREGLPTAAGQGRVTLGR
jgi:hypothetical protein